eukprot:TRINITY_DN7549_c0_g1_i1.p1 TRINITY_DN7549_c0_g1~~TRINITY_DN7549_c0_g1_i1.p1  ORF type:complete len:144 (-),score=26.65 TRINITY_DN7549_c0_g1_i1:10-441(-)
MKFATAIFALTIAVASAAQVDHFKTPETKVVSHKFIHAPKKGNVLVLKEKDDNLHLEKCLIVTDEEVTAAKEHEETTDNYFVYSKQFSRRRFGGDTNDKEKTEVLKSAALSLGEEFVAKLKELAIENGPAADNPTEKSKEKAD